MKTKKGEKERLRTVILERAIAYLKKHGRSGAGTDQIMKYAGLSRGALYSHFKSKDDLFAQAVCHDLAQLEASIQERFEVEGPGALRGLIEDHLSDRSLRDVGSSCAFTSLSTDMQRCSTKHRALFEEHMKRIYALFAHALGHQFPEDSPEESMTKAINLFSALVGTLTMARTIKDPELAKATLEGGIQYLIQTFVPGVQR